MNKSFNLNSKFKDNHLIDNSKDIISKLKKSFDNSDYISNIIKKYAPTNTNGLRFIVFCEDSEHLSDMQPKVLQWISKAYGKKNRIKSYTILSSLSNNKEELNQFNDNTLKDIKVLFCVNKLNEGLHLKSGVDSCILLRKTNSGICYMQQIGRVFDCSKKVAKPVIFDFVNNIDNIKGQNFTKALNKSKSKTNFVRKNLGLSEINVEPCNYVEIPNLLDRFEELDKITFSRWNEYYNILATYKKHAEYSVNRCYKNYKRKKVANISWIETKGKIVVTVLENPKNYPKRIRDRIYEEMPLLNQYGISIEQLYGWCEYQEELYFKGLLSEEHKKMLANIDFPNLVKTTTRDNYNVWEHNFNHCSKLLIKNYNEFISSVRDFSNQNNDILPNLIHTDIVGEYEDFLFSNVPKKIFDMEVETDEFIYSALTPTNWILKELRTYVSDLDYHTKEQTDLMFKLLKQLNISDSILNNNWKLIEQEFKSIFNLAYVYVKFYELQKAVSRNEFDLDPYTLDTEPKYYDINDDEWEYLKNSNFRVNDFLPCMQIEKEIDRYRLFNILYEVTRRTLYSDENIKDFAILKDLDRFSFFLIRNLVMDSLVKGNSFWFVDEFFKFLQKIDPEYKTY